MGNQSSRKKESGNRKYKIPPGAGKPDAPSKPTVEYIGEDVMVRWNEPNYNGGCPVIGYILQFNRVDGSNWESYRVNGTECLLKNLDDTFVFRVVAENLLGYSEPSETSVPVSFEFSEPVLLVPLNNINRAIEFEKVELNCRIWGMPIAEVTWYLNGDEIMPNDRIYMQSDGIDYKMVFNHIKISDEGEIRAVGKNLLGEIESTAKIVVEAPPRIKVPRTYDEGIICRGGENLRLKFGCTGRPKPVISFYHNGDPINGRYKTQEIGDIAVLTLENVTREEGGEYSIRVENCIGEDVAHVLVTVTDRPQPPGKPMVIQLSDNSCVLEWEQNMDDVNNYLVEYYRDGWGVWLKALSTKNRGCKIRDLIPGSKYRFRIKAENHFGISDGGEESVQIYIPDSNKEQGSVMSSIQEDEFEVLNDNFPEASLELHKNPVVSSPKSDIKRQIEPTEVRKHVPRVDSPYAKTDFFSSQKLSPNLPRNVPSVQEKEKTDSLERLTKTMRSDYLQAPQVDKPMKREPTLISRNQLIGGSRLPNCRPQQDESKTSTSGNVTDSKDRYYEQYSKTGKTSRGQDRFEKYRKDSKMDDNNSRNISLDSNKELGASDGEPNQGESSRFLIVEDGSEDEDEDVEFVVSQLVVPVKNGNVKISTSFDSGSVCASSVKSSTDDLSFDFLTRNNTPDVLLNETIGVREEREGKEGGGGSRVNLLQSFAEFTNLNRGNERKVTGMTHPPRRNQDNEFFIRPYSPNKNQDDGGEGEQISKEDSSSLKRQHDEDKLSDSSEKLNENSNFSSSSNTSLSLQSRINKLINFVVVLCFFGMLGPLLFMNLFTFVLFCLLLIKLTFM